MEKLLIVLAMAALAQCFPYPEERLYEEYQQQQRGYEQIDHQPQYKPAPAPYKEETAKPYAFDYGVRDDYSGANYGHSETSDGGKVEGSYQVALPDGRIQIVTYVADHINGFQAKVEYKGEAVYPEHKPQEYQPSYKHAPEPSYKSAPEPSYEQPRYEQPRYKQPAPQQYHPSESQINYQEAEVHEPSGSEYQRE